MSLKYTLGTWYCKYRTRVGRGGIFTAEIDSLVNNIQRAGILAIMVNTYFHTLVPLWVLPTLWVLQKVFQYFMGYYDEKYLKWWAFESKWTQENVDINPIQHEIITKIRNIEKLVQTPK